MRLNILDLLLPRETKFYNYLEEQIDTLVEGCKIFRSFIDGIETMEESEIKKKLTAIKDCELRADIIERRIIDELHETFITPIDREDIHLMAINIDKSLDILNSIARKFDSYNIRKVPKNVCIFAEIICDISDELRPLLDYLKRKDKAVPAAERMHKLENKADDLFHQAIAELFSGSYSPIDVIKFKEVYEHLESIIDSIDFIGKIVRGIMVKLG